MAFIKKYFGTLKLQQSGSCHGSMDPSALTILCPRFKSQKNIWAFIYCDVNRTEIYKKRPGNKLQQDYILHEKRQETLVQWYVNVWQLT